MMETLQEVDVRPNAQTVRRRRLQLRLVFLSLMGLLILGVLLFWGIRWYQYSRSHVSTDNAQIEGHLVRVAPRVGGYVQAVLVEDDQPVTAGQLLVVIDSTDYVLQVRQAEAALAVARAGLESARTALAVARAQRDQAAVALHLAEQEAARVRRLQADGAVTQQQVDRTLAALEEAQARYQLTEAQLRNAQVQIAQAEAHVHQMEAALAQARQQLSYTQVRAPISGQVAKKSVEPGQFVQPGQPLMVVVGDTEVWVVANLKETDLAEVRPGQPVDIEVDAYPDHSFRGVVASIAGAAGVKFALIPPDNAVGNFVKVTQKVPVKIRFETPLDPAYPLRPGMNVVVHIQTR